MPKHQISQRIRRFSFRKKPPSVFCFPATSSACVPLPPPTPPNLLRHWIACLWFHARVQVREALADLPNATSAITQSPVTALLVPVSDVLALAPRPLIEQVLYNATVISALLGPPTQRSLTQRSLIAATVKHSAALQTLPELQRTQVAAAGQFMRVPSGSCVFYKVSCSGCAWWAPRGVDAVLCDFVC